MASRSRRPRSKRLQEWRQEYVVEGDASSPSISPSSSSHEEEGEPNWEVIDPTDIDVNLVAASKTSSSLVLRMSESLTNFTISTLAHAFTYEGEGEGFEGEELEGVVDGDAAGAAAAAGFDDDNGDDDDAVDADGDDNKGALRQPSAEKQPLAQAPPRADMAVLYREHVSAADELKKEDRTNVRIRQQLYRWDAQLEAYPVLERLEAQTGIKKVYIVMAVLSCFFGVVFLGYGIRFATASVGFLFPMYASFKCIENPSRPLVRQWLTYWIVYAAFVSLESVSDFLLYWIPLYNLLKLSLLIWCFLPRYRGATKVYRYLIKPLVAPHKERIRRASTTVVNAASFLAAKARKKQQ